MHARWTAKTVALSYDLNYLPHPANPAATTVTYDGTYAGAVPAQSRTGYVFDGWFFSPLPGGDAVAAATPVSNENAHTLYAHWTPVVMTVTYDAATNGGTVSIPGNDVTYDAVYGTLPVAFKTGYAFDGWYTAASGGSLVAASAKVSAVANHTLYAHYSPLTIAVNFDLNYTPVPDTGVTQPGDLPANLQVDYDAAYGSAAAWPALVPTRLHWQFDSWNTQADGSGSAVTDATVLSAASAHTLYAKWTEDPKYTVTYHSLDASGGNVPFITAVGVDQNGNADGGSKYYTGSPANVVANTGGLYRNGYYFTGWCTLPSSSGANQNGTFYAVTDIGTPAAKFTVTGNVDLYPVWVASIAVIFDVQGGDQSVAPIGVTFATGTYGNPHTGTWPAGATRAGYTFAGWFTSSLGGERIFADTRVTDLRDPQVLYAQWTAKSVAVTFYRNDGSAAVHGTANGVYGGTLAAAPAVPVRAGYKFLGWSASSGSAVGDWVFGAASGSGSGSGGGPGGTVLNAANGVEDAGGSPALALYAVWEADVPDVPTPTGPAVIPVASVTIAGAGAETYEYCVHTENTRAHSVTVLPADADNKAVAWSSGDVSVASVDAAGLVRFTGKEGNVTITAASKDGSGVRGSKVYKVVKHVTAIRTALKKINISVRKKASVVPVLEDGGVVITGSRITYKSSKPKVAKVDSKGRVTGLKAGKAVITVTAANGRSVKVNVTVVKKAVKLKKFTLAGVKKGKLSLRVGKAKVLKIKLSPAKATNLKISFKSSKKGVATVDAAGKIRAVKKGKATITVKVGGKTVKVKLTVK